MDAPVRLVVTDDLRRSRLTVFFRLLLVIPLYIALLVWTIGAIVASVALWVATLVRGTPPAGLHGFLSSYVRYATHVSAYVFLAANPYPGLNVLDRYPVDLVLPEPARQARWRTALRLPLALPALLLAATLGAGAGGGGFGADSDNWRTSLSLGGIAGLCAFLGWFASLATGRMPNGLRDLGTYGIGYTAQTFAYLLLLTDRYPSADPEAVGPQWSLPHHAIGLDVDDDGKRSRLTVLFRLLLALPHFVWLTLWTVAAIVASFLNWIHALVRGRSATPLHRFLAAFVRYSAHVTAFVTLVGNRFPGFTGEPGYAVDITIGAVERQSRWATLFRGVLVLPALLIAGALAGALVVLGFLGWFAALATGRMPRGLHKLGVIAVRYLAQTSAYWFVVTDDYPYASPALRPPPAEEEPAAAELDVEAAA